jgi:hypothetical protein
MLARQLLPMPQLIKSGNQLANNDFHGKIPILFSISSLSSKVLRRFCSPTSTLAAAPQMLPSNASLKPFPTMTSPPNLAANGTKRLRLLGFLQMSCAMV